MKKIVGLTIAILLSVSAIATGTWALTFSDGESGPATLTAGTLDLSPMVEGAGPSGKYSTTAGGNGVNGNVLFANLLPGETGTITWVLSSLGTLEGTLDLDCSVLSSDVSANEIESAVSGNDGASDGDLDQYMGVRLQRGIGTDQANAEANFSYILGSSGYVAVEDLAAVLAAQDNILMAAAGGTDTVVYKLSWDLSSQFGSTNQNIVQSDTFEIDVTFTLNQTH